MEPGAGHTGTSEPARPDRSALEQVPLDGAGLRLHGEPVTFQDAHQLTGFPILT